MVLTTIGLLSAVRQDGEEFLPFIQAASIITSDSIEEENGFLLPSLHQERAAPGQRPTARPESASPNDQGDDRHTGDRANQRAILMSRSKSNGNPSANDSSANLGFEDKLWLAADKLRARSDGLWRNPICS